MVQERFFDTNKLTKLDDVSSSGPYIINREEEEYSLRQPWE